MSILSTRRELVTGVVSSIAAPNGKSEAEQTVRTFDDLRKATPQAGASIYCLWREKLGDGGGGRFEWSPDADFPEDGGCVIGSAIIGIGRWKRQHAFPLNPVWFGADPSGGVDSTLALRSTFARDEDIYIPPGTFRVSDTLSIGKSGRRISGAGQGATRIVMEGRNRPVIRWRGARALIENLQIEYEVPQDVSDVNSAGIMIDDAGAKNTRALQKSAIRNVSIRNAYVGFLVPTGTVFFSVTVDNLEIDGYAKSAFYMARGSSGTGSAILNLYTQNGRRHECIGPVVQFTSIVDGFIGQVNIEHTKVRDHALFIESNDHVSISSLHVEGCDLLSDGKAFVAASGNVFVSLDVLSVQFSKISKNCSIFFLYDSPRISTRSLTVRDLSGEATMSAYNHVSVQRDFRSSAPELAVESVFMGAGASERVSVPSREDKSSGREFILRQWGQEIFFRYLGSAREYFGTHPPASGIFQLGDRMYNVAPRLGEPAWWTCLSSGTPGQWQPGPVV